MIFAGDFTPLVVEPVAFTITVTSVTNPATVQPLTYKIQTTFNGQPSQIFSASYSIQTPLPLSFTHSRTNDTYGQQAKLSIKVNAGYPKFNEIKMLIPTKLMQVNNDANNNYQVGMVDNNYEVSKIYTLTDDTVTLNIVNPTSTNVTSSVQFSLYLGGYLSAQGHIAVGTVKPVYLGLTASITNRTVGSPTQLNINFKRDFPYSNEKSYVVQLASTLFDLTNAKYNGSNLHLPLTVPLSTSGIVITGITNLLSVPHNPSSSGLTVYTIDVSGDKVGQSSFDAKDLSPNKASTGLSYSFTRSNTAIGGIGSLAIVYTPRFVSVAGILKIYLP